MGLVMPAPHDVNYLHSHPRDARRRASAQVRPVWSRRPRHRQRLPDVDANCMRRLRPADRRAARAGRRDAGGATGTAGATGTGATGTAAPPPRPRRPGDRPRRGGRDAGGSGPGATRAAARRAPAQGGPAREDRPAPARAKGARVPRTPDRAPHRPAVRDLPGRCSASRRCAPATCSLQGRRAEDAGRHAAGRGRRPLIAKRGTITDRHGAELAVSEDAATVFATPFLVKDPVGDGTQARAAPRRVPTTLLKVLADRNAASPTWRARLAARKGERIQAEARGHRRARRLAPLYPERLARVPGARRRRRRQQGSARAGAAARQRAGGSDGEQRIVRDARGVRSAGPAADDRAGRTCA